MAEYISALTGPEMDAALQDMAQHNSEAWAVGTRGGTAVSSTDATYHNNSKYYATQASASATSASSSASTATNKASAANTSATLSQSWAIGGTGTRSGEDTNNAKYWSEQAQAAAGGGVSSFNGRSGVVLPQSGDYTAAMVGALPSSTSIPSKTSDLTNDSGFITSSANITGTAAGLSTTLDVNKGGTGKNTWTANQAVITGSTATGAFTSRGITNNTATSTALTANTNLITANTLRYHTNRTTSVAAADTNYTTYMARGAVLVNTDTTPTNNGQIAWVYA